MPRIWIDYCQFLVDQGKIIRTRRTFDRALRALPITQHMRIWPLYLKFIRLYNLPETAIRIYRRYMKVCTFATVFLLIAVRLILIVCRYSALL
jgi:pre-mRNA-splicing factor SYF1